MSREQTKANQYIERLDDARCNGDWSSVPELIRKIKKHAPQRTCLATTAASEYAVFQASITSSPVDGAVTVRSFTAVSTKNSNLSQYLVQLSDAIDQERTHTEDVFQAKVCLGWIHWYSREPALAIASLPDGIEEEFSLIDGISENASQWTRVCAIKAAYIKGSIEHTDGAITKALDSFESCLPILASQLKASKHRKEWLIWSELYLTTFCIAASSAVKSNITSTLETRTLSAFRSWSRFWDARSTTKTGDCALHAEISRQHVWKEYYITLSSFLQRGLPFPTTDLTTIYTDTSTRLQQRAELKLVETRYENLLLSELPFPRAEEGSEEVELFVELVMQNWRILCGRQWKSHDLGEGGAEAVTRGVLDIIYRAATKTFHSTAILRHLFTLHLAVAEFELAFRAFDTYMDIVKKGKARVEKTGVPEPSLDADELILKTASECITAMCRYGSSLEVEKAQDIGQYIELWMEKHCPLDGKSGDSRTTPATPDYTVQVSSKTLALAWRCVGIAYAQWARSTYEASSRAEVQFRALKCFRRALLPQYDCSKDIETLFAFATLLAERGEISPAIEAVKIALLNSSDLNSSSASHRVQFSAERSLIPLWHLMSLLLSARHEFLTASRSCEGAFEQFQDMKVLFGESYPSKIYHSAHINDGMTRQSHGIVDEMDYFEKENILQVKMTQLVLMEILDGPEMAVNASDELLSLYTRLFGDVNLTTSAPSVTMPPQSSAGTVASVKGSMFGRHGRSLRKAHTSHSASAKSIPPTRPQTMASVGAPTIQITSENAAASQQRSSAKEQSPQQHESLRKHHVSIHQKKNHRNDSSNGIDTRQGAASSKEAASIPSVAEEERCYTPPIGRQAQDSWLNGDEVFMPFTSILTAGHPTELSFAGGTGASVMSQDLPKAARVEIAASEDSKELLNGLLPSISVDPFSARSVVYFTEIQQGRWKAAVLVNVWLMISGFYRRAYMYDDAKGAIDEAQKIANDVEKNSLKDNILLGPGSDTGRAVDGSLRRLLADIKSERGYLALAEKAPFVALAHFESSLTWLHNHPAATVGLANILLDIYAQELILPPAITTIVPSTSLDASTTSSSKTADLGNPQSTQPLSAIDATSYGPLGLSLAQTSTTATNSSRDLSLSPGSSSSNLQPSHNATTSALLHRLAARDRAYGLLTALTKLGTGWNYSEAWYALARAYEEGGQPDKAREVLWWCVELEEGKAVRSWNVAGSGGYVLI